MNDSFNWKSFLFSERVFQFLRDSDQHQVSMNQKESVLVQRQFFNRRLDQDQVKSENSGLTRTLIRITIFELPRYNTAGSSWARKITVVVHNVRSKRLHASGQCRDRVITRVSTKRTAPTGSFLTPASNKVKLTESEFGAPGRLSLFGTVCSTETDSRLCTTVLI